LVWIDASRVPPNGKVCALRAISARRASARQLARSVAAIYRFWLSLRREQHQSLLASTFRREGPKPGRNDRCSCGNGKKFKKRCGLASTLQQPAAISGDWRMA